MQPARTNGERRAPTTGADVPHPLELPEIVFAAIFIPIAAFSWVGILLAECGVFSGWRVFTGGALISALALVAAARDYRASNTASTPVSKRSFLILAVIVATAAGLFSRPGEYLIEGADASVYLAVGQNIARAGGIVSTDPVIELVPRELRQSFFLPDRSDQRHENRLPGGLRIAADGTVAPSFFHLLPVWIAIATTGGGPYAGYYVNVILAVLSVIAVWLIGRRVWSPAAGGVAATLLALNFGQIYYARMATSEVLTQFLLLSWSFFTVVAWDSRLRVAGACAGVAVGLAAFTRVDALLLMVPLAAGWLVLTRHRQFQEKAWLWYGAILVLVSGHAILHAWTIAGLYTQRLFADGWRVLAMQLNAMTALAAIVAAIGLILVGRKLRRHWLLWVGLVAVLALALLRPAVVATSRLLLSPLGLAVAFAGVALLSARRLDWRVLPVIVPFLAEAILLLMWGEETMLPADFRRAVPTILPGAMLLIGFVVSETGRGRGWLRRVVWLLPVVLGVKYLTDAGPILWAPLARGLHGQVADLARHVPEGAVVITDWSVPGHLSLALQFTFDRPAIRLDLRPSGGARLGAVIERAIAAGHPVFAAVAPLVGEQPDGLRRNDFAAFDMREEFRMPLRYEVAQPVQRMFPKARLVDHLQIALYRIARRDPESQAKWPLTIDIGSDDFPFILQGFHATEMFELSPARWTTGESRVALPRLARPTAAGHVMVLRLSAHRPAGTAPAVIRLAIDGLPLGIISGTTSELREYRVPLPAPVLARVIAGPTILTISSDTFVPRTLGVNDDGRRLGIVLDWVRIE